MLLSEHIRLVAAFDHRHVFLDPDPDPVTSYAERRRLFDLQRSSWADYDTSKISAGGGVYPRTAKSIPVSAEVRAALRLDATGAVSPPELIRAILTAPVDLLWNGGIGTYVKAAGESHADVGDKANDPIRVNGRDLRVKVVGEGGNLGLTQRGRIEYARSGGQPAGSGAQPAGGRIFTDFIDNSAGVDCSDHEVNIKILLGGAVTEGELTVQERDELLAAMTDEVAALVLRDNYEQANALGTARAQAHSLLPVHRRMLTAMEKSGQLNRELEALPTDKELAARHEAGDGLTPPEFAVLLAYVKIGLEREVLADPLVDEPWTTDVLAGYFPTPLRERFAARMAGHRLRREIISTVLVNEVVNRGGTSFVFRAMEESGASAADVIRAYVVVRESYGLRDLWAGAEALDNRAATDAQTLVFLETRRLLDRAVRWLVSNRRSPIDVAGEIARLRPGVGALLTQLPDVLVGAERESMAVTAAEFTERGIPRDLAEALGRVVYGFGLLDILETAGATGQDVTEVAKVYFVISERFQIDLLLSQISRLPRGDRWQTLARMALRYDLYSALAGLTAEVLHSTPPDSPPEDRVSEWEQVNAASIARAGNAMGNVEDTPADLAALSVLLRQIRTLVKTSAAG
jgi:glutamate dehydrogenase